MGQCHRMSGDTILSAFPAILRMTLQTASATFRKFTPKRAERHHKVLESTRLRHTPFARKMYTLNIACMQTLFLDYL
jgi:hypothetical protein